MKWIFHQFKAQRVPGRPTILKTVGQGPTALAVGAGGVLFGHFYSHLSFLFLYPSLWETARYKLKYCLKGPLNPKQPTNQIKAQGLYSLTTDRQPVTYWATYHLFRFKHTRNSKTTSASFRCCKFSAASRKEIPLRTLTVIWGIYMHSVRF